MGGLLKDFSSPVVAPESSVLLPPSNGSQQESPAADGAAEEGPADQPAPPGEKEEGGKRERSVCFEIFHWTGARPNDLLNLSVQFHLL